MQTEPSLRFHTSSAAAAVDVAERIVIEVKATYIIYKVNEWPSCVCARARVCSCIYSLPCEFPLNQRTAEKGE